MKVAFIQVSECLVLLTSVVCVAEQRWNCVHCGCGPKVVEVRNVLRGEIFHFVC